MTRLDSNSQWTTLEDVLEGRFLKCFLQKYEYFRSYPSSALPDINARQLEKSQSSANELAKALKYAKQCQKANSFDKAEHIYRQILQHQPNQPDALCSLSSLTLQAGKYQESEQLLKTLIKSQPKSLRAWFSLANLYQHLGKLEKAIDSCQQAISLQPNVFAIYNNLGYVYQQQGQLEQALATYQQALKLQPDCIEAKVNIANVLFAQGKLDREQQIYYAALNNDLGFNSQKAKNLDTAIAYYQQAIALQPQLTIARYNLAVAWELKGDLERAKDCYENIIEFGQSDSSLHYKLSCQKYSKIKRSQQ